MKRAITMLAGLAALAAALPAAAQDTVAKVKQAGVIVVGVKQDYKPWGYLDPTGKIVGSRSTSRTTSPSGSASRPSSCRSPR